MKSVWAIYPDLGHLPPSLVSHILKFIMKCIPLLLAIPISLLAFFFYRLPVFAQTKAGFGPEAGYYSPASKFNPYDKSGVEPYPPEADSRILNYHLGQLILGIEGKTHGPDSILRSGDAKSDRILIFGIGFRF